MAAMHLTATLAAYALAAMNLVTIALGVQRTASSIASRHAREKGNPGPIDLTAGASSFARHAASSTTTNLIHNPSHRGEKTMNPTVLHLTPSGLQALLAKTIPAGLNVLVSGMPGVGKTDNINQAIAAASADLILSHPAVEDPTVAGGLPMAHPGDTEATFLPFGKTAQAMRATKPTVWVLEDFGQANESVQKGYMQYLLGGELNGHKLPNCVSFIALTNRRVDRAGVSGILEPVKSRFAAIVELQTDVHDWSNWALDHGIGAMLIAFLRFKPDLLAAFVATADLTNSPVPRTWANLDRLEKLGLPADVERVAFAGAVGSAAAGEYLAFRSMAKSMVNIDAILMNPDTVKIPTKPDELYATVVGLASRASDVTARAIATYANRLNVEAKRGEYAALLVRDSSRLAPIVNTTEAFMKLFAGPMGQMISGRA